MANPQESPYGSWRSPITSDLIVADAISIYDVLLDGDEVYWVEGRPREAGRYVLVRVQADQTAVDVTPAPFNVRTRVHEYGGGAVALSTGTAYFSHFPDQRLYRQSPSGSPEPVTPADPDAKPALRYADGVLDTRRNRWVGVREDHRMANHEATNTIVGIDLPAGGSGRVLVEENDFFSSPRISADGCRMAWLAWNHPNMPWTAIE